jgi:hypothetical protein
MISRSKKILVFLFILILFGSIAAYFIWNKPHQDVANASGIKTDAPALYKAFTTDSVSAKKTFIEKVTEVSGTIHSVSKNQQDQTIILLKTGSDGAYINCTMEEGDTFKDGSLVTLKGICSGLGQGDAEMGIMGDVYLTRCYIKK